MKDFRDFITRGNLIELAVAVLMATAIATLVTSLTKNLISPLLAAIGGKPDFSDLTFTINNAVFRYGAFITDVIAFLIFAFVIYFFIVKPFTRMMARWQPEAGESAEDILKDIRAELQKRSA
ncbi:MAG: large conductance mechanosensitive channel protein MscL [Thermoleophilia bacterium]|nr:large conductance mechanosensitive channel protein MscL [Thermoleophilia bacterium]